MRRRTGMDERDGPYDSDTDPYAAPIEQRKGKVFETVPAHPRLDGKQSVLPLDSVVTKCGMELFEVQFVTLESPGALLGDEFNTANLLLASYPMQLLLRVQDTPRRKRLFLDCLEPMPELEDPDAMPLLNQVKRGRRILSLSSQQPLMMRGGYEHSNGGWDAQNARQDELEERKEDADTPYAWPDDPADIETLRFIASIGRFASGRSFRFCLDLADITAARLHVPGSAGGEQWTQGGAWGAEERAKDACLVLQVSPLCLLAAHARRRPFAVRAIACTHDERVYQTCDDWTPHGSASRAHQLILYGSLYEMSELASLLCRFEPRLAPLFDSYGHAAPPAGDSSEGSGVKGEREEMAATPTTSDSAHSPDSCAASGQESAPAPGVCEGPSSSSGTGVAASACLPLSALMEAGRELLKTTMTSFPPAPVLTPLGPHLEVNEKQLLRFALFLDTASLARLSMCSTVLRRVLRRHVSQEDVRKMQAAASRRRVAAALASLGVANPDDSYGLNHCLLAGILRGHIVVAPQGLETVLLEAPCWCCTFHRVKSPPLVCSISHALRQPMTGDDYHCGNRQGAVTCSACLEGNYITDLCAGAPRYSNGRSHNHCEWCDGYGQCIGDIRNSHCHDCGTHYFAGCMEGDGCDCRGRGRFSGEIIVPAASRVPIDKLGAHWDGRDAGQAEVLDACVLDTFAELDLCEAELGGRDLGAIAEMGSRERLRLLMKILEDLRDKQAAEAAARENYPDGEDDDGEDDDGEDDDGENGEASDVSSLSSSGASLATPEPMKERYDVFVADMLAKMLERAENGVPLTPNEIQQFGLKLRMLQNVGQDTSVDEDEI